MLNQAIEAHADDCGDRVVGVALSPKDFNGFQVAEFWGLPVLEWDEVDDDCFRLLCETTGTLMPDLETVDEFEEYCRYRLKPGEAPSG